MNDFDSLLNEADFLRDTTMEANLIRPIVPIREWVVSEYYAGPDIKNLYPYWRNHLINIFDESRTAEDKINEIIITGCLTGDTIIPLLSGENVTIKELADRGTDYEFDVYSVDTNTGNIVAGHGHNARKTGDSRNVYKVTLDNGKVICATENHPFLMRDLTYKRLDELEVGDSLYPFNRHLGNDGYERVYNCGTSRFVPTHRLISKTYNKKFYGVVHHKNHNKLDNRPSNLKIISRGSHTSHHHKGKDSKKMVATRRKLPTGWYRSDETASKTGKANWDKYNFGEEYKEKREQARIKSALTCRTEDYRKRRSIIAKKNYDKLKPIDNTDKNMIKKQQTSKSLNWLDKHNIPSDKESLVRLLNESKTLKSFCKKFGIKETTLYNRLKWLDLNDLLYDYGYTNHQVVSIEFVRKDEVYDIEVDDFHNFALDSGCFVHNSIGTGKTTFANFVMLRFLYEISCYDNPQALFNLMMTSKIAFFYFNITKEQANLTGYGQLREMIDASPYFREYFKRNERKSNDIEWLQQKMYISYGSSTGHIIGTNLLGSILDEANFYQGDGGSATVSSNKDVQSKAAKIYTNIINRRKISLFEKWCFANIINDCFIFYV